MRQFMNFHMQRWNSSPKSALSYHFITKKKNKQKKTNPNKAKCDQCVRHPEPLRRKYISPPLETWLNECHKDGDSSMETLFAVCAQDRWCRRRDPSAEWSHGRNVMERKKNNLVWHKKRYWETLSKNNAMNFSEWMFSCVQDVWQQLTQGLNDRSQRQSFQPHSPKYDSDLCLTHTHKHKHTM